MNKCVSKEKHDKSVWKYKGLMGEKNTKDTKEILGLTKEMLSLLEKSSRSSKEKKLSAFGPKRKLKTAKREIKTSLNLLILG